MKHDERVLIEASMPRSYLAIAIPIMFMITMTYAVTRTGHSILDYPDLVFSGKVSILRQLVMWMATIAFILIYIPPAIVAVKRPRLVMSDGVRIITATGKRFVINEITELQVKRNFWNKILEISCGDHTDVVNITFANGDIDQIRERLSNEVGSLMRQRTRTI